MNPLVIYHASCADGFGAAYAAWTVLGDTAEYQPAAYNQPVDPNTWVDRDVFVLDFSFAPSYMAALFEVASNVTWLDHHASSKPIADAYQGPHKVVHDNAKSGARLAWEHFHHNAKVPELLLHVEDRDLWKFKLFGTREVVAGVFSHQPWSFPQWHTWVTSSHLMSSLAAEGEALLRDHDQRVGQAISAGALRCTLPQGQTGLAVNCAPDLASDVGNKLAAQSATFGLCWVLSSSGAVNCSLRSIGDYDVSTIAQAHGGGGHRNAAGFKATLHDMQQWLGLSQRS